MQTGTQDIRLPVQPSRLHRQAGRPPRPPAHGRTIFTYICPETGKEFDVLGRSKDLPSAKVTSDRFDAGRAVRESCGTRPVAS